MALSRNVRLIFAKEGKKSKESSGSKIKTTTPSKSNEQVIHTVVYGDNLWNLAKRYLGAGNKFKAIYDANKTAIEQLRKMKGDSAHYKGYWIAPGMKLVIPVESSAQTVKSTGTKKVKSTSKSESTDDLAIQM